MGKLVLNDDDLLFLNVLYGDCRDHLSEISLKTKLFEMGMSESTYNIVKKRLIFSRYIGSLYGNVTLEKKDFKPT